MGVTVYGIAGCDTVRRGAAWLGERGVAFERVDFARADNLDAALRRWVARAGLARVLNARSATLKRLDPDARARLASDEEAAIAAMAADPRLIKRPLLETDGAVVPGFDAGEWGRALA